MKKYDKSRVFMIPMKQIGVINPRSRDQKVFEKIVQSIAAAGLKRPITVTLGQPGGELQKRFEVTCLGSSRSHSRRKH